MSAPWDGYPSAGPRTAQLGPLHPVGPARELATAAPRLVVQAIDDGDTTLAAAILDEVPPESPDNAVATVAGRIGIALGLLDDWLCGKHTVESHISLAEAHHIAHHDAETHLLIDVRRLTAAAIHQPRRRPPTPARTGPDQGVRAGPVGVRRPITMPLAAPQRVHLWPYPGRAEWQPGDRRPRRWIAPGGIKGFAFESAAASLPVRAVAQAAVVSGSVSRR